MQNQKVGIIIQARVGSTRLKEKLKREFFNKKSLGQVVFENLNSLSREFKTIVATTKNIEDDYIEKLPRKTHLQFLEEVKIMCCLDLLNVLKPLKSM